MFSHRRNLDLKTHTTRKQKERKGRKGRKEPAGESEEVDRKGIGIEYNDAYV